MPPQRVTRAKCNLDDQLIEEKINEKRSSSKNFTEGFRRSPLDRTAEKSSDRFAAELERLPVTLGLPFCTNPNPFDSVAIRFSFLRVQRVTVERSCASRRTFDSPRRVRSFVSHRDVVRGDEHSAAVFTLN